MLRPGEQAFIITETSGQCAAHPLRVDNYRELEITPQGVICLQDEQF